MERNTDNKGIKITEVIAGDNKTAVSRDIFQANDRSWEEETAKYSKKYVANPIEHYLLLRSRPSPYLINCFARVDDLDSE